MKKTTRRKTIKVLLWSAAALLTLTVLFYAVERWRGARAWAKTKADLAEQGETLDFDKLRPKPVPPQENFAATRLIASLTDFKVIRPGGEIEYRDPETRNQFLAMRLPDAGDGFEMPPPPSLIQSRPIDLKAWAVYLEQAEDFDTGDADASPAIQIENAFRRFDADFNEIAEAAANRPSSSIPVQYGDSFMEKVSTPLPHLIDLMQFSKFLTVKGAAAAAGDDTETAKQCIRIQLKLAEAVGAEPFLIKHLVALSILNQASSIVHEGLLAQTWKEDDLKRIIDRLESIDLYERGANALRGEMTGFFLAGTEFLKSASAEEWALLSGGTGVSPSITEVVAQRLIPDGWLDQNASFGCELFYRNAILPFKSRDFSRIAESRFADAFESTTPYNFFAKLILPATDLVVRKTIRTQFLLDAVRTACGLELFYLRNQAYPDSLEALAPEYLPFIPIDPMTGGPLSFKRVENGYRLYSVGLNGKDEGGALFRNADGEVDQDKGDWVYSCERSGQK